MKNGICIDTLGSFYCQCRDGYEVVDQSLLCVDYDECFRNEDKCQQHCDNSIGSYTCSCEVGYSLNNDGLSCLELILPNQLKSKYSFLHQLWPFEIALSKFAKEYEEHLINQTEIVLDAVTESLDAEYTAMLESSYLNISHSEKALQAVGILKFEPSFKDEMINRIFKSQNQDIQRQVRQNSQNLMTIMNEILNLTKLLFKLNSEGEIKSENITLKKIEENKLLDYENYNLTLEFNQIETRRTSSISNGILTILDSNPYQYLPRLSIIQACPAINIDNYTGQAVLVQKSKKLKNEMTKILKVKYPNVIQFKIEKDINDYFIRFNINRQDIFLNLFISYNRYPIVSDLTYDLQVSLPATQGISLLVSARVVDIIKGIRHWPQLKIVCRSKTGLESVN